MSHIRTCGRAVRICLPPELKGSDINLGAVLFYEVGQFFGEGAVFAPGAISFYQGGDICRGTKLFYDTGPPTFSPGANFVKKSGA